MDNNTGTNTTINPTPAAPENTKTVGPLIGLIIILAIIILGGVYFWMSRGDRVNSDAYQMENMESPATPEEQAAEVRAIEAQSSADDVGSIEADLNSYDESDIDSTDSNF